jgi:hypothetical protein
MPGGHDPRIHRENAVRTLASLVAVCAAAVLPMENAYSWGQEGHSIVAEIAQHRLNPAATQAVTQLLGPNVSLASISSWADDVRGARPGTYNWHFVDIPGSQTDYVPARDCQPTSAGDCIVNELMRLRTELRCGATDTIRREALKFAVHFVGDVHQPLHAIGDKKGGNAVPIHGAIHGQTCTGSCPIETDSANLHALWDSGLIHRTVWDWGAYVRRRQARRRGHAGRLGGAVARHGGAGVERPARAGRWHAGRWLLQRGPAGPRPAARPGRGAPGRLPQRRVCRDQLQRRGGGSQRGWRTRGTAAVGSGKRGPLATGYAATTAGCAGVARGLAAIRLRPATLAA